MTLHMWLLTRTFLQNFMAFGFLVTLVEEEEEEAALFFSSVPAFLRELIFLHTCTFAHPIISIK